MMWHYKIWLATSRCFLCFVSVKSSWIPDGSIFLICLHTRIHPNMHTLVSLFGFFFTPETTSETWLIFQTKSKDAAEKNKSYKNSNVGQGRPENSNTTTQVLQWGKSVVMCSWKTLEIPCDFFFFLILSWIYLFRFSGFGCFRPLTSERVWSPHRATDV